VGEASETSLEQRLARMRAAAAESRAAGARSRTPRAAPTTRTAPPTPVVPSSSGVQRTASTPEPAAKRRRFDVTTWAGALAVMVLLAAVLYAVEAFDVADGHGLDRFGIHPRQLSGLDGVVFAPFLHAGWWHLISNTVPFVLLGWVVLVSGLRTWLAVTGFVLLAGGLATWLVAPPGVIVGVSGVVFGWLGYLIARAFVTRRLMWIAVAVLVFSFFGSLFGGLLPSVGSHVSWQAHLCGFVAGLLAGWLLHGRHRVADREKRQVAGTPPPP
jgi:membrane associated rhomboid family serine protease